METHSTYLYYWLLIGLIILAGGCRNKAPDGFSADFDVTYDNGGMAPDLITLQAQFADADQYDWSVEGVSLSGRQVTFNAQSAGSFYISLEVESGKHAKTKAITIPIENYPTNGSAMTIVQGNGVIGSFGVDGANPFFIPIDTIDPNGNAGMDYDDNTKELYYTGSIIRAFPNGAEKRVIFTDDQLSNGGKIVDLVVDADDQRVYFAVNGFFSHTIASIDHNGNNLNVEAQVTFLDSIFDTTLDAFNNMVYFTAYQSTSIYKTILGDLTTVYGDNFLKYAIVFDNSTGNVYYAEQGFDAMQNEITNIMRFNPENYNSDIPETWPQLVVANASSEPIYGIDISESKQDLYWSDSKDNVIYRVNLNNPQTEREVIFTGITNPKALAIGNFD